MAGLRPLLVFLAAAFCFFWGWLTYGESGPIGTIEMLETQASDGLFLWRERLFPDRVPVDSRILLLTVDRQAELALGKPSVLWTTDLAQAAQKLLDNGALAVGIDFAGNPYLDKSPPALRQLIAEGYERLQDVLVSDRVVLIEHNVGRHTQEPAWPDSVVAFAGEGRNSCVANFLVDPDGTIRRLPLTGLKREGAWVNHTFALRLAELALGQEMKPVGEGWTFPARPWPDQGRHDSLRLNFPGAVPQESLARFLQRAQSPRGLEFYRGKIVILVPDFPADRHPTPFAARRLLGGEIHAAGLNSVLTGNYLHRLPRERWAGLLALGCWFLGGVAAYAGPAWTGATLALLVCLHAGAALWAFTFWGMILPLWSFLGALGLGLITGLSSQFLFLDERRRSLRQLLGRMVSHQVAEELLQRSHLRAERRQITLLFSDINGFTPTCERLAPEQVLGMLNRYFQEMVTLIDARGGYVKQFVGDEIMAVYGAPKPSTSHPRDAVYTAIAMMERLEALRERDPEGTQGFYSVKLGINTGEAVLGSVGSAERWEYAAVGDDVNLAARLENLTTRLGVDVLVSKFTRDLVDKLPPPWRWKSMGIQTFKGKNSQLEVYTLEKDGDST